MRAGPFTSKRGFTLIELLVVILLPALGRAKTNAVRVKCAAVLRQWGVVVNEYAQEFGQFTNYNWNQDKGASNPGGPYSFEWSNRNNVMLRTCPGDPYFGAYNNNGKGGTAGGFSGSGRPVSYSFVHYTQDDGTALAGGSANNGYWRVTDVSHPSTALVMCDGMSGSNVSWITDLGGLTPTGTFWTAVVKRHGFGNVLFLDGHVSQEQYQDYAAHLNQQNWNPKDRAREWTYLRTP